LAAVTEGGDFLRGAAGAEATGFGVLSLTTMPSGAYAFEISDIQEDQAEGVLSQATRM